MIKYIGKRLLMMIPVLLGVVLVVFSMMYFSPGRAADYMLGDMATEEDKLAFEEQNGLNRPFLVQYVDYVWDVLHGDLGTSYSNKRPVLDEILARFPNTLMLCFVSMVIATVVGVTLGIISATKQYTLWDNLARVGSIVGISMPSFWEGMMLILLFSVAASFRLYFLEMLDFTRCYHFYGALRDYHADDTLQYAGGDSPGLCPDGKG